MLLKNNHFIFTGALLTVEYVRSKLNLDFQVIWSKDFGKNLNNLQFLDKDEKMLGDTCANVARYLARKTDLELYG